MVITENRRSDCLLTGSQGPHRPGLRLPALAARAVLLLALAAVTPGCVSGRAYFQDRVRDAADILTVTVGDGHGVKARVGPIQSGLFVNSDYAGLRGGESHRFWTDKDLLPTTFDVELLLVSGERFDPERFDRGRDRHKCFAASGVLFLSFSRRFEDEDWSVGDLSYYTQAEVAFGLFKTVRLGLNAGELLDFLLGWTTLDIFDDDLGK